MASTDNPRGILRAILLGAEQWREVGEVVAASQDAAEAKMNLAARFGLADDEAGAILDQQWTRLTVEGVKAIRERLADD